MAPNLQTTGPLRVFVTGATGYIGSTAIDLLLHKGTTPSLYSLRALVRSPKKASLILPLGIEPILGSLDDLALLEQESAQADVVLSFADADHLPSIQAILRGLSQRPRPDGGRKRPILIHTSGTGVLLDNAYGAYGTETIYYDNDLAKLNSLAPSQPHRNVDLEIISPALVGLVDTYIVAPPTIWGQGTGPGNHTSIQIPLQVRASLLHSQAMQLGQGLNVWSKIHVIDLAHLYLSLLERALQEPQDDSITGTLPKNQDAYYFCQEGEDFSYGDVAKEIAKAFKDLGINDSGTVRGTKPEEESALWLEGAAGSIGGNSRSRAIKAREILGWVPEFKDFAGYIHDEIKRQLKEQGRRR
ncbi:NAD-P-binding protein [Gamsiella multidivaricata]|uniref:NAD-P-binding protein n=1 Tax=Gamsiella multidivaricata TaxID=101098 RepID=UPI00221FE351|nr:NAD-P-binding protein [Gamsiella multidivaricata]KAI7829741.1 NAD-P-binding protein [Gamsiella multidivaricata]